MKRRQKKRKPISPRAKKWIIGISLTVGLILGLLVWLLFTRCGNKNCFFYYFPLTEIVLSGMFFGTMPFAFFDQEQQKKNTNKKRNNYGKL